MQNLPNIVRDRLKMGTPASHPDADMLNAFSERLLPERERAVILQHLAHCGDCREVVALSLPENADVQPDLVNSGSHWFAWPALRWAVVAAGIAIVSVGIVEYQHHVPNPGMMAYKASTEQEQESAKSSQALPVITAPEPAQHQEKLTTDLVAKNEAKPTVPGPEKAPASASPMKQFHGSGHGAALGGPVAPTQALTQWQQHNTNQNQVGVPVPSTENATPRAAQAMVPSSPQAAPFDTQLAKNQPGPALSGSGAGFAVDKAKLPVPPPSPANGMLSRQSVQDAVGKVSPQPAPGQIGGYVVDPSGAVVSNARITITPSLTGQNVTAVTNSQGAWLIAGLSSGSYRAEAAAPGFKTTILDLNYDANQPSMFSFTLSPGNVSETVEVSSAQMQVQRSEMKPAVSSSSARARNMEQLAALSPGRPPLWSISAAGTLQRSFDQGNTWQDVSVSGAPVAFEGRDLDISAEAQSVKDDKAPRVKAKSAGKKDTGSPVFRAVIVNGSDVWAGGLNGSLYHSADAGNRWTRIVPSSAGSVLTGDIVGIEFPDPQHGKLSTSTAETWITDDSGQTWRKK
jgi:hypothetical protein